MQTDREAARKKRFDAGLKAYYRANFQKRDFDFSTIGFEFTAEQFITELASWKSSDRNEWIDAFHQEKRFNSELLPKAPHKAA